MFTFTRCNFILTPTLGSFKGFRNGSLVAPIVGYRLTPICKANIGDTTFDPDVAAVAPSDDFRSKESKEWLKKIKPFDKKLAEVPALTESNKDARNTIIRANDKLIYEFAKAQIIANGLKSANFDALVAGCGAASNFDEQKALIVLRKALNTKGKFAGIMDAISIAVQERRDLEQQKAESAGFTVEEYRDVSISLRKVANAKSAWGRYTSTKDYILNTPVAKKVSNQQEFDSWVSNNLSEAAKIMTLTVADIPVSYAPTQVGAFLADETNTAARKALEDQLTALRKKAHDAWAADKNNFKLSAFLDNL